MSKNTFASNLFGTIAGNLLPVDTYVDFIPTGKNGETMQLKDDAAVWMGLRNVMMQKGAYDFCYAVGAVTDRLSELDITAEMEVLRLGGKGKNNFATGFYASNINRIFEQPNRVQSWGEFRGEQLIFKRVFGFCPVYNVIPAGFGPESGQLFNLPPWRFKPIPRPKSILDIPDDPKIAKWRFYKIDGTTVDFTDEEVMILEDSFMRSEETSYMLPQSKLVGLDMVVSNLCAAEEADNVLLRKKGPLGFISHDIAASKDSIAGALPMTKRQKKELQGELTNYGLNLRQFQYVISRVAAKWNPISFNVTELGTKETIVKAEKAICHRFGYPYVLYEVTDSTFSNSNEANKTVYQNVVIPNANKDMKKYEKFLKAKANNCHFAANYDNLPVLQEDRKEKSEADKAQNESLQLEYDNDLITKNQWREARGYDTVPGDDVYKSEVTKKEEPTAPANENTAVPPQD